MNRIVQREDKLLSLYFSWSHHWHRAPQKPEGLRKKKKNSREIIHLLCPVDTSCYQCRIPAIMLMCICCIKPLIRGSIRQAGRKGQKSPCRCVHKWALHRLQSVFYKAVLVLKHYLYSIIRHKGRCVRTFRIIDDLIHYTISCIKKWLTFEIPLLLSPLWLLIRENHQCISATSAKGHGGRKC